ncbi:MAG: hypothetical protein ABI294_01080, partial [Casimicrobiaceae bacterium]
LDVRPFAVAGHGCFAALERAELYRAKHLTLLEMPTPASRITSSNLASAFKTPPGETRRN